MPRGKRLEKGVVEVKITYPVWIGDRQYQPGETATVPADIAEEWIEKEQAVGVAAEVKWQQEEP